MGIVNKIVAKVKKEGAFGFVLFVFRRAYGKVGQNMCGIFNRLRVVKHLRQSQYTVVFHDEGAQELALPKVGYKNLLGGGNRVLLDQMNKFITRPAKEVLLRKIVFDLYKLKLIDPAKHIIDIGCWLGDNSVVWAGFVDNGKAKVFAVDPCIENIEFVKLIARHNNVKNIEYRTDVCSDVAGVQLYYEGNLNHARFNGCGKGKVSPIKSTTLDDVVGDDNIDHIGLLHVDVEKLEEKVLSGALKIISKSRPAILFEQHISREKPERIFSLLEPYSYKIYMINEVLPGCSLDCRNFLAVPTGMDIDVLMDTDYYSTSHETIWHASYGPALILCN